MGAAAASRLSGGSPDAVVVPVEQSDGPVASAHQALRTEAVERDFHRGSQVVDAPSGPVERRVEPGNLGVHVGVLRCVMEFALPASHPRTAERRLPRWSITMRSRGKRSARLTTSSKWRGNTTGTSRISSRSSRIAMLSSTGARNSQCSGRRGEMADGSKLGAVARADPVAARRAWVLETHPRGDCADPVGAGGFLEQVVGVRIEAGALNHDDRIDAVTLESGAMSAGPNGRAIAACSSDIQGCGVWRMSHR